MVILIEAWVGGNKQSQAEVTLVTDGEGSRASWLGELDTEHAAITLRLMAMPVTTKTQGPDKAGAIIHKQAARKPYSNLAVGFFEKST